MSPLTINPTINSPQTVNAQQVDQCMNSFEEMAKLKNIVAEKVSAFKPYTKP